MYGNTKNIVENCGVVRNVSEVTWLEAGKRLKELRLAKEGKPSVHKVAKALHISGNYWSELERGLKCPSDIVIHAAAEYFGVDKVELYTLYGKTVKESMDFIIANPDFHRTITHISMDKRLTEKDRERIVDGLSDLYKELINKKKQKNEKE